MGYVNNKRDTEKVVLPSNKDYWVEIITDLRFGDIKQFSDITEAGAVTTVETLLKTIITAWNIDDENGKTLDIPSVNPANLDLLRNEDAFLLMAKANASLPTEDEKKSSPKQ